MFYILQEARKPLLSPQTCRETHIETESNMASDTQPKARKVSWLEDQGVESRWARVGIRSGAVFVSLLFLLLVFRITFVNFVDNYHMGYKFDARTGEVTILDDVGYFVTPPIVVKIHTVDLRPWQVCINANKRVLNCKLVQFKRDKKGLELFISWHGRMDYEGGGEQTGSFTDILKSYAYEGSGKTYPFMTILRDLKPEELAEVPK